MADPFKLRVIAPSGVVVEETVTDVVFPGRGDTGVLPGHARYSGIVETGVLQYTTANGRKGVLVSGGFARFSEEVLTILADEALTVAQVKELAKSDKRKAELQQQLLTLNGYSPEWEDAQRELKKLEAQESMR